MAKLKKGMCALLASTMLLGALPAGAANVSDINGHWAQSTIQSWIDSGRISGYEDGTFRPENNVTRAEMVTLINKAFGFTSGAAGSFTDLKSDHWAYAQVQTGVSQGYVSGNSDGTFQPDAPLTRAQAAVMLAKVDNLSVSQMETSFSDDASIPGWAKPYVRAASLAGVMNGYPDGSFGPNKNLTRAEAVISINKALSSRRTTTSTNDTKDKEDGSKTNTTTYDDLKADSKKTYSGGTYDDIDVTVNGVTLKNVTAEGDLTITKDVANGTVTLTGVRVKGDVYVYGGGKNSIDFTDCQLDGDLISDKTSGETVALKFDDDTTLKGDLRVQSDTTISPNGSNKKVKISDVIIEDKDLTATISSGVTVSTLALDKSATGTKLTINGTVSKLSPHSSSKATVEGSGTITKLENSSRVTVKGSVSVGNGVSVTGVTLDHSSASIAAGKTVTLKATVKPSDASNDSVTWSSNNESIAKVDSDGVVTGIKAGTATITVKTNDGSYTDKCTVTVTGADTSVSVTGVSLNETTANLTVGGTLMLTATVEPSNATNKNVSWSSDHTDIALVSNSGLVTAQAPGTAKITATTDDGSKTAACSITVIPAGDADDEPNKIRVEKVTLDETDITLNTGDTKTLTASVMPIDASDQTVAWESSDDTIASVSQGGEVTANMPGTAAITVKTTDGDRVATCNVTVESKIINVTDVTLVSDLTLNVGEDLMLTANILPDNATNKDVVWLSRDENIASVNDQGMISAHKKGETVITVTTVDGAHTAVCSITVKGTSSSLPGDDGDDLE